MNASDIREQVRRPSHHVQTERKLAGALQKYKVKKNLTAKHFVNCLELVVGFDNFHIQISVPWSCMSSFRCVDFYCFTTVELKMSTVLFYCKQQISASLYFKWCSETVEPK